MKKQSQNKPNLLDAQMNITSFLTKDYNNEQRTMNNERLCKTNPIKANFKLEANLSLRERRSLRVDKVIVRFFVRGRPPRFLLRRWRQGAFFSFPW